MIRAGTADTTIKDAPLVGAWIEIQMQKLSVEVLEVSPLVGAWIEIVSACKLLLRNSWSLLL